MPEQPASARAVFLSYASQDKEVARRICDALRAAGLEVWFDVSELRGGDAWDQKIRKQIKECALFVPLITPTTNARAEGYFRLEWKLAVDRSHLLADDHPFLFPIAVGDVDDATARVPDKFREVQWTKLRLDETPGEIAGRITKLLCGGESDDERDRRERKAEKKKDLSGPWTPRKIWKYVILITVAYYALRPIIRDVVRDFRGDGDKPAVVAPPKPEAPAPQLSDARQLAQRARAMSIGKYDSTADDFATAEGLLKKALELDPTDGEIWAVSSQLNFAFASRGFDRTPARNATARAQAERALILAPDSTEAMFAMARWQRDNDKPEVAEASFKKLLERDPNHAGALHSLGYLYDRLDRVDEAAALYAREARQPGAAALAHYTEFLLFFGRARFAEAENAVKQSIAVEASVNSQAGLAMLLLTAKGDAEGAIAALASGPAAERHEHRPIYIAALAQLARRQPEETLAVLRRLADPYVSDNWYNGPKAYFVGLAHAQAGRPEAARVAWEEGLALVEERLVRSPADRSLLLARGELYACLGREAEARRDAQTVEQLRSSADIPWILTPVRIYARLGRTDDALRILEQQLGYTREGRNVGWPLTPALLRIDPRWDNIRGDPRFQRLCADPATARDWPKHAELKKAVALLDRYDCIPEDLRLAEEIVQRVLDQAPTDPETVTAMSRVQAMWLMRGWDRSSERYVKAKRIAERAVQLAPDEPEALAALAMYLNQRGTERPRARELLERAIELAPGEARFHRWRNELMWAVASVREEEKLAGVTRMLAQFPNDALVHYDASRHYRALGRMEDADREVDATLAIVPLANALVWKARSEFGLRHNLAGMKAALDRVPQRVRSIERTVFAYFIYAVMSGDYAVGVEALNDMAEPWMIDFDYRGPKALPLAALLERQGKPALARIQYEIALKELKQRQAAEPDDLFLKMDEAWVLHGLGRDDEARAAAAIYTESMARPYRLSALNSWWFHPIAGNLVFGDRGTALALMREAAADAGGRETMRRFLATDPRLVIFRDDAEIRAILEGKG